MTMHAPVLAEAAEALEEHGRPPRSSRCSIASIFRCGSPRQPPSAGASTCRKRRSTDSSARSPCSALARKSVSRVPVAPGTSMRAKPASMPKPADDRHAATTAPVEPKRLGQRRQPRPRCPAPTARSRRRALAAARPRLADGMRGQHARERSTSGRLQDARRRDRRAASSRRLLGRWSCGGVVRIRCSPPPPDEQVAVAAPGWNSSPSPPSARPRSARISRASAVRWMAAGEVAHDLDAAVRRLERHQVAAKATSSGPRSTPRLRPRWRRARVVRAGS